MEKKSMGRRKFIKVIGGLAVAAGAAGALWKMLGSGEEIKDAKQPRSNAYTEDGKSLVSITKGSPSTNIETMVRDAVDAIGGIDKVVTPGMTVVVKPALLTANLNCAPDPRVVAAVVKIAREAGGTVILAESSGDGSTAYNLEYVGITVPALAAGAEVRPLTRRDEIWMEIPNGRIINKVKTFQTIYDCDVLISVPRLKRHLATTVTMALKNAMGVIPPSEMGQFHNKGVSQCIADLNTVMKPDLTVLDATYAMVETGPLDGTMVPMDTIMAAGDPVAIDTIGAQRLHELEQQNGISTFDPTVVSHINLAAAQGVGTNDPNQITVIERNIA
ncbi:MAG: DUF362 domain-containing protein [Candidatus Bathyarchaeota archaeon]|nr:DUF362 domain-containing protein [Candidatus Bathyarchaeota archaeon]